MKNFFSRTSVKQVKYNIGRFTAILGVLYHFRRKTPKTTVMQQNVAISEISSDLTEMTFFCQRHETEKY